MGVKWKSAEGYLARANFAPVKIKGTKKIYRKEDNSGCKGCCIEKCSTPGPVGGNDEEHASPLPNVIEQAKIIFEDLDLLPEAAPSTSTTTSTTTTVRPIDNTITNGAVVEPQIVRKVQPKAEKTPSKKDDVEVVEHNTKTGELERAQAGPQNSTAVYAIVGVGLFLAVIFIICFIKKRQAKKKDNKRREIPNSFGEELKPLSKHNQNSNEKPVKNVSNLPEHVPLINGQNGKPKDDTPALKSFTPLEHPETVQEEEELEQEQLQNDASEDVEIRPKSVPELLTPQERESP
ncbi:hypothetical protein NQ318_010054 [Aromia moschata]|uniref:Uncharacterized protein n=1 Tax=Aromia moschata TaxID=1265417 RepID=A0AAV8YD82_9CUCU|nr:hypothetical protein NQ318_010054 [Aromia moschata]